MCVRAMSGFVTVGLVVCLAGASVRGAELKGERPLIQVALLLDTSGSMDGLIDQAKSQLWKVINEFVTAERNGRRPDMRVALYEYGNDGLPASEGHIRQIVPLTDDLDKVSEELFALKTNGGSEYCGQVIRTASRRLEWSASSGDLKAIFIAGNEPFTQGKVNYVEACREAIGKGITVSTIFCGPEVQGVNGKWKEGALLADGSFMNIDQSRRVVHIAAPQDKEIAELGVELNKTYISYGKAGRLGMMKQASQDANSVSSGISSQVQRAVSKASHFYNNGRWDLVDAAQKGGLKLEDLKAEDLPETMRKMSPEKQKAFIEAKSKERAVIQAKIVKLNDERKKYVATKRTEMAEEGEESLDSAVVKSLRVQAAKKGFNMK